MVAINDFFGSLPAHLMAEGVLGEAEPAFSTMTVRGAFKCDGSDDNDAEGLLGFTNRGFNTFDTQAGDRSEDAFGSTPESHRGDLAMTVLRHEAA